MTGTIASLSGKHSPDFNLDQKTPEISLNRKVTTRDLSMMTTLTPLVPFPRRGRHPNIQRPCCRYQQQRARAALTSLSMYLSSTEPYIWRSPCQIIPALLHPLVRIAKGTAEHALSWFPMSRSRSRWDFHFHSYVLTIYARLY